mgnify:CR=1 FL=1
MAHTAVTIACEEKSQPSLKVGDFELASRLVVGTGKYASYAETVSYTHLTLTTILLV